MKPLLALAALAAAVVLLRRRKPMPEPDADDSEVVGMPTTWSESYPQTANATTWTTRRVMMFAPTSRN